MDFFFCTFSFIERFLPVPCCSNCFPFCTIFLQKVLCVLKEHVHANGLFFTLSFCLIMTLTHTLCIIFYQVRFFLQLVRPGEHTFNYLWEHKKLGHKKESQASVYHCPLCDVTPIVVKQLLCIHGIYHGTCDIINDSLIDELIMKG